LSPIVYTPLTGLCRSFCNTTIVLPQSNSDAIIPDPNQPSEIVESTASGLFVKEISVDPNQGGSVDLNVQTSGSTSRFAAVDDNQSVLDIWTLPSR